MNQINNFVSSERTRYSTKYNNRFAFWFNQISQYSKFLDIIYNRYIIISKKCLENNKQFIKSIPKNTSGPLSTESRILMSTDAQLGNKLLLEIESFYLFAKIVLDKIAYFVIDYFGTEQKFKMKSSHHGLTDHFGKYAKSKKIKSPKGFLENAKYLRQHISDYRDDKITHLNNPRLIKGFSFDKNGNVKVSDIYIYPQKGEVEKQGTGKDIKELKQLLDKYINQVIELVETNRDSTTYDRESPSMD